MGLGAPRVVLDAVSRRFGALEAVREVSLDVGAGEVVCLLGPSGCGKSTTLRIVAGVERQSTGRVLIDGREVAGPGGFVPPEGRGIGLMFQDYALFPHLSVAENVAFGLTHLGRAARDARVRAVLAQVHMERFTERYPSVLSGGEQQRVALARALAPAPGVMLMDEPFSGLDVPKRDRIRDETWQVLKDIGAATLLVTHDPKEAMRMADRIALMRAGRIVQLGRPDEIYNAPVDAAAAAFFSDLNVFNTRLVKGVAHTPLGAVSTADTRAWPDGTVVQVMARPHAVILDAQGAAGGVPARVSRSVLLGPESLVEAVLERPKADLVRCLVPGTVLPAPGEVVSLRVAPENLFVFRADA